MMRKQSRLIVFVVMCMMMSLLAACSGGNGGNAGSSNTGNTGNDATPTPTAEEKKKDPVTLSFVISNTVDLTPFNLIFEKYTEQTGNKVEIQALPGGDFDNMMKTRFSTGDYPDLFLMQPGTKQNIKLRAEETLLEWSQDNDVWSRIIPTMKEFQTTANDEIYGVPFGATGMMGIYYNKDVFAEAGITEPNNYGKLIENAKTLKEKGFTPFYEGVKDGWPPQVFYLTGWVTEVDPAIGVEGVQQIENNELKLADVPAIRSLFEKQKEIHDLDLYQKNVLAGTYDEMQNLLGEGKVGMVFMLDGIIPQLELKFGKEFVEEKIGFFPFPSDTDKGTALITPPNQLMVPKDAKHKDTAIELVKFMISEEMVDVFYEASPGIPIFEGATSNLYAVQEVVAQYIADNNAQVNVQNRLSATFADLQKTLQTFFINGDVDAALKEFSDNYVKDGKAKLLPGFE